MDTETSVGISRAECRNEVNNIGGLAEITSLGSNNYSKTAKDIRDTFRDYFDGQAPWQLEYVTATGYKK